MPFGKRQKKMKQSGEHAPPVRKTNEKWSKTGKQKADIFEEHLEQVLQLLAPSTMMN